MANGEGDFRVLSLDGGGAKGVYTLGILKEIEATIGRPIHEEFDLIFGTSTGAIIAALLALGKSVDEVKKNYFDMVPEVMSENTRAGRTSKLRELAHKLLGDQDFFAFKTDVGIVATDWERTKPRIFKASPSQAHGMKATFVPGFGATIVNALLASGAAFPFFERVKVPTANQGTMELIDGGFIANNPTLFAIADALFAYKREKEDIKVLSLGTGVYKEPKPSWKHRFFFWFDAAKLAKKVIESNTVTTETLTQILFRDISVTRINDAYTADEYATDLLESNLEKLEKLNVLGRESFSKHEDVLRQAFGW